MSGARELDVAIIGGGQAALAVGFALRRSGLTFAIFDEQDGSGGAWRQTWPSLHLFSPAQWSSLPGWMMPGPDAYSSRDEVIAYLAQYERRYELPIERPVRVSAVSRGDDFLHLTTSAGEVRARAVVSATGTWANPVMPEIPGQDRFSGDVLHAAQYADLERFTGRRVIVVGGGNSGAQIVAELSEVAQVTWATREPPTFLPDEVDGRFLFEQATVRYKAIKEGRVPDPPRSLGDIVVVPSVKAARERGALQAVPMFVRYTETGVVWDDGRKEAADAVIYATGYRPALSHLAALGVVQSDGRVAIEKDGADTRAIDEPRLWLVGYGEWTGFASATLIGVGRSARATADEIVASLAAVQATPSREHAPLITGVEDAIHPAV